MLIKQENVEIMLDIYSGRPNPSWLMSVKQMEPILEKINNLPSAERVPRDKLGYRGFIISNVNRLDKIPERIVVFKGIVAITENGKTEYYRDINDLEKYLQKMAEEVGYKKELTYFLEFSK